MMSCWIVVLSLCVSFNIADVFPSTGVSLMDSWTEFRTRGLVVLNPVTSSTLVGFASAW